MTPNRLGQQSVMADAAMLRTLMPGWVWLTDTTKKTSAAWNVSAYSSTVGNKIQIDLSTVFGIPVNVRAVLLYVAVRDSGAVGTKCYMLLGTSNALGVGLPIWCSRTADDFAGPPTFICPCDANGDIWYQIVASGAGTFDVSMEVWGYQMA